MAHPLIPELEPLVQRVAAAAGFTAVEVHLLTHRIPMTVQVLVRRGDGSDVSLDDCAALSAPLAEALEASDLLSSAYVLEVSSPGIGEELSSDRDFQSFRSFPVAVERRTDAGATQTQEGLLLGRDDQAVLLNVRGRTVRIPREAVLRVRLVSPDAAD